MIGPLNAAGQQRFVDADARLNIWDGSVRASKTVESLLRFVKFVREAPPGNLLLAGKTERTLKRNVIDPLIDMLGKKRIKYIQGMGQCIILGRRCYVAGASDARAEQKIRGLTLCGAYGDEITTWPESFFSMLMSRLSVPGARFYGTTNPDSPMHWLKVDYLDRINELNKNSDFGGSHLKRFKLTIDDNPYLDPVYVSMIKQEYVGLWYRRYILGEWCVAEGAIYDMLDIDNVHVVRELPHLVRHWVGADYGTSNPTVWFQLSQGEDGRLYAHHSYRWDSKHERKQKTDAELSRDFLSWQAARVKENKLNHERMFYDPSAASFGLQLFRDNVQRLSKADNEVADGIRQVSSLLASGVLVFHGPTMSKTDLEEMVGYAWDDKAQLKGEDKPVKANDHFPDALRYAVRGSWQTARRLLVEWEAKKRRESARKREREEVAA